MSDRRWFLALILVASLLRLGYACTLGPTPRFPDGEEFRLQAHRVVAGQGAIVGTDRIATRPPLLSLVLAPFVALAGDDFRAARIFLSLLSLLSVLLVGRLGREVGGSRLGLIAAGIVALDPFLIYLAPAILTETLFVYLLVAATLLACRYRESGVTRTAFWVGVFLGLAALTRASALLLPLALLPALHPFRRPRGAAVLLLGAGLVVAPGVIVPSMALGRWVPITSKGGQDLYEALGPGATGRARIFEVNWPAGVEGLGEGERDRFLREKVWEGVRENPGRVLDLAFRKAMLFWSPVPNAAEYRRPEIVILSVLFTVPLLIGGVLGLLLRRPRGWVVLLAPVVYFALVHMVFLGSIRYRIPLHPLLAVFAASGVLWCWERRNQRGIPEQ